MRTLISALALTAASVTSATAQSPDGRLVRTFVVERHVISQEAYERATQGRDVRLASTGRKPKPHARFEVRGQGDVFTGWTMGDDVPYRSPTGLGYEFVGSVGEVQPGPRPDYRTLMMRDSRLVKFFSYRDAQGQKVRIPLVRKSEVEIEFPLDGSERAQVYAIPRGKKKFDYRLVTVREDVARRRMIRMLDGQGRP